MMFRRSAWVVAFVVAIPLLTVQASSAAASQARLNLHVAPSKVFAPNSRVQIVAWPSGKAMSKLKPGDSVPVVSIANSITDSRGDASLVLDTSSLPDSFSDSDGDLSLEVRIQSGSKMIDYVATTPRSGLQSLAIDPSRATISVETHKFAYGNLRRVSATTNAVETRSGRIAILNLQKGTSKANFRPTIGGNCTTTVLTPDAGLLHQDEWFVAVWTGNNIPARINESIGTTNELTIGASATGTNGSWSASGTSKISTNIGYHKDTTKPTWYANDVNYTKSKTACAGGITTYQIRPGSISYPLNVSKLNTVAGQVVTKFYTNPTTNWCSAVQPASANGVPTTSLTKAQTIAGSMNLLGLSVSATTTWQSGVDISWMPTVNWKQCFNNHLGSTYATDTEVHAA